MGVPVFPFLSVCREHLEITTRAAAKELRISHSFLSQCEDFEVVPDFATPVRSIAPPGAPGFWPSRPDFLGDTVKAFLERCADDPKLPKPLAEAAKRLSTYLPFHFLADGLFYNFENFIPIAREASQLQADPYRDILRLYITEAEGGPGGWYFFRKTHDSTVNLLLEHHFERMWGRYSGRRKSAKLGEVFFMRTDSPEFLGQIISPQGWMNAFPLDPSRFGYEAKRLRFLTLILYILTKAVFVQLPETGTLTALSLDLSQTNVAFPGFPEGKPNPECEQTCYPLLLLVFHGPVPHHDVYLSWRQSCYCIRTST